MAAWAMEVVAADAVAADRGAVLADKMAAVLADRADVAGMERVAMEVVAVAAAEAAAVVAVAAAEAGAVLAVEDKEAAVDSAAAGKVVAAVSAVVDKEVAGKMAAALVEEDAAVAANPQISNSIARRGLSLLELVLALLL